MDYILGAIVIIVVLWHYGLLGPFSKVAELIDYKLFSKKYPSDGVKELLALTRQKNAGLLAQEIMNSNDLAILQYARALEVKDFDVIAECAELSSNNANILTVYAQALIDRAWEARGGGAASSVSTEGFQKFFDNLHKANEVLQKSISVNPNIALSYALMVTVQMGLSDKEKALRCFEQGRNTFPANMKLHLDMLKLLTPRWLGDKNEADKFAYDSYQADASSILSGLVPALHLENVLGMSNKERRAYFKNKQIKNDVWDAFERLRQAPVPSTPYDAEQYYMTANVFAFISIYMNDTKLGKAAFKCANNNPTPYPWSYYTADPVREFFKAKYMMR